MATLAQIRTKADAKLAEFWPILQAKQDAYFAKHGKYFQLLVSPTVTVVDGVDTDFGVRHPTDEPHQIDFGFASQVPFQIEVHEWVNGGDRGYKAIVTVELLDGRIFTRNRDSNQVDSGWSEIIL